MTTKSEAINALINDLKLIDGTTDSRAIYNTGYTFNHNLHGQVYRGNVSLSVLNDFPFLVIESENEARSYQGQGTAFGSLTVSMIGVVWNEDGASSIDTFQEDVEHVVNAVSSANPDTIIDGRLTDIEVVHSAGNTTLFRFTVVLDYELTQNL